jgi:hypothetical protein
MPIVGIVEYCMQGTATTAATGRPPLHCTSSPAADACVAVHFLAASAPARPSQVACVLPCPVLALPSPLPGPLCHPAGYHECRYDCRGPGEPGIKEQDGPPNEHSNQGGHPARPATELRTIQRHPCAHNDAQGPQVAAGGGLPRPLHPRCLPWCGLRLSASTCSNVCNNMQCCAAHSVVCSSTSSSLHQHTLAVVGASTCSSLHITSSGLRHHIR